jgi:hypothetical protein
MAEPTSTMTFQDMVLRVAEAAGMAFYGIDGQRPPMVPVDYHDLDKCKRIVNDAIRLFVFRGPENGWKWRKRMATIVFPTVIDGQADSGSSTSLTDATRTEATSYFVGWTLYIYEGTGIGEYATVTAFSAGVVSFTALSGSSTPDSTSKYKLFSSITSIINFDSSRIILPEDFGGVVTGKVTYVENSPYSSYIEWVDESFIRSLRASNIVTGYPNLAAIKPYLPTSSLGSVRRWELVVDPQPTDTMTLQFPYISMFDQLRMDSGMATAGSTTTLTDTNRTEADNYYFGWTLRIMNGTGAGETALVTGFNHTTKAFSFTALSGGSTPDATSAYVVEPVEKTHAAGAMFDQTILDACMCQLEMQIKDVISGAIEYFEKISLPAAWRIDKQFAPRTLGNMSQKDVCQRDVHNYNRVINSNDI